MIKFYYNLGPNPYKVALCLEEMGLPYEAVPVDTRKGEQFTPGYLAINPNAKAPSIVDGEAVAFDSNAILLYLAEKTGTFLPEATPAARGQLLSWLMFIASGLGPYAGQAVHFNRYAPEKVPYAINRYAFEAERHFAILNDRLATHRYMLGDVYTIVDMALWGWARLMPTVLGDEVAARMGHLQRFMGEVSARPAAQKALAMKDWTSFKTEQDAEANKHMFPHNERRVA